MSSLQSYYQAVRFSQALLLVATDWSISRYLLAGIMCSSSWPVLNAFHDSLAAGSIMASWLNLTWIDLIQPRFYHLEKSLVWTMRLLANIAYYPKDRGRYKRGQLSKNGDRPLRCCVAGKRQPLQISTCWILKKAERRCQRFGTQSFQCVLSSGPKMLSYLLDLSSHVTFLIFISSRKSWLDSVCSA